METNDSFEDDEDANDTQPCDANIILLLKWALYTTTSLFVPSIQQSLSALSAQTPPTHERPASAFSCWGNVKLDVLTDECLHILCKCNSSLFLTRN